MHKIDVPWGYFLFGLPNTILIIEVRAKVVDPFVELIYEAALLL